MHILELSDFVQESRGAGKYVYMASIDVAAAFDNVPHGRFMETLESWGTDPYICRYVNTWLRNRVFKLRLRTSTGCCFSSWRRIAKGVPQGGVHSPFLWLLHINPFIERVKEALKGTMVEAEGVEVVLLLYADDVVCILAHRSLACLRRAAAILEAVCAEQLARLGLRSERDKSANPVLWPNFGNDALFRRKSTGTQGAGPGCTSAQPRRMERDGPDELETGCRPREELEKLPYSVVEEMRVLGVVFDDGFKFLKQYGKMRAKARVRMAIMKRLAGTSWGLETTMMRVTGEALVVSLLRYGLTTVGSGLEDKVMRRVDTGILNVMARMTTGVTRSARIPILHAVAGILSMHNLYIQQCASMLDLVLRASRSTIENRIRRWLARTYDVEAWEATAISFVVEDQIERRIGELQYLDFDVQETWLIQVLPKCPSMDRRFAVHTVFHSTAVEARQDPIIYAQTYDYQRAESWFEVGLQVLAASGWRPDCALDVEVNVQKTLPPKNKEGFIVIEPSEIMRYTDASLLPSYQTWFDDPAKGVSITVGVFFQQGVGVSCAAAQAPDRLPSAQGWILGEDGVSESPPVFVMEAGLLQALLLVEQHNAETNVPPPLCQVKTGTGELMLQLMSQFNEGVNGLQSAATTDIASVIAPGVLCLSRPILVIFSRGHVPGGLGQMTW